MCFLKKSYTYILLVFLGGICIRCTNKPSKTLFEEIPSSYSNLDFKNTLNEELDINIFNYLYYYNGAGVAAGDYNGDGKIDLFFGSNQNKNILYLNLGQFKFKKINFPNPTYNNWTTGISNVDINNDGKLDIYICQVTGLLNLEGHNLLYINMGNDKNGHPIFKEQAKKYNLDFSGYSTQATFFDYDKDGDLDMYLLNHSLHPNGNYGKGSLRDKYDPKAGDILYRNDNNTFTDVSKKMGIKQGKIGYGLGISIGDLNNDSYPDIYIGNDFFENDYLYINKNGTFFEEIISQDTEHLGHTTHFSMGNAIADFNNDNLQDIVSLDMLPEDLKTYKTSGLEHTYQTYMYQMRNGYAPQYMQNTLHINRGDLNFSEVGYISGITATEWSWSVLAADFDNDMLTDIYVTNGIKGVTNDMDFISYAANEEIQKLMKEGDNKDYELLKNKLPEKKVQNYIFKNKGNYSFLNKNDIWIAHKPTFSQGAIYTDLDQDGDLDIVTNNTDDTPSLFKNKSSANNYLKINLKGDTTNILGIGANVKIYVDEKVISRTHYLNNGYLSSLAPNLHFGLGSATTIDSLQVIWPNKKVQLLKNINVNQTLTLTQNKATDSSEVKNIKQPSLVIQQDSLLPYKHKEHNTLEFNKSPLIPFGYANEGPPVAVADFNKDGLEDIALGGGKYQALTLYHQDNGGTFTLSEKTPFKIDAKNEDTGLLALDVDNDGDEDLIAVSGGNEFTKGPALQPRIYINNNGSFIKDTTQFKNIALTASSISTIDLNGDKWPDLYITSSSVPNDFSATPKHIFFINKNGKFIPQEENDLNQQLGSIQDTDWSKQENMSQAKGYLAGHWMPITILHLDNGNFSKETIPDSKGWWNAIVARDFDNDGDIDIIAGNWGLNSRFTASTKQPITLYANDYDNNGTVDPVITYYYKGIETPFSSYDELVKQMPFIKKKFPKYASYAQAEFKDILPSKKMSHAIKKEVQELGSCYFENLGDGSYKKSLLPKDVQLAPIFDILPYDINNDGHLDVIVAGNNYEISTQLGRLDALPVTALLNDGKGKFKVKQIQTKGKGPARNIEKIKIQNKTFLIITKNGEAPIFFKVN